MEKAKVQRMWLLIKEYPRPMNKKSRNGSYNDGSIKIQNEHKEL